MKVVGHVYCSVEKWCGLVDGLTKEQRDKLCEIPYVKHMLEIPSIAMHEDLIKYMVESFDVQKNKFVLQSKKVEVSATGKDVQSIFGFEDEGLDVDLILDQVGDDFAESIPERFLSRNTENLVIDDLVNSIVESGDTDDDFVRKVVLVLFGTVIAPQYAKIVPKNYYALVVDVKRMQKLNVNKFTLGHFINGIIQAREGTVMKKLPKGNMALMQVERIF